MHIFANINRSRKFSYFGLIQTTIQSNNMVPKWSQRNSNRNKKRRQIWFIVVLIEHILSLKHFYSRYQNTKNIQNLLVSSRGKYPTADGRTSRL